MPKLPPGWWQCICGALNETLRTECRRCHRSRIRYEIFRYEKSRTEKK